MCRLLGVTRQGYYAYAHRPPSARVRSDAELCAVIRDELARDFKATRPNARWVTDVTYVWTDEAGCTWPSSSTSSRAPSSAGALDTNVSTHLTLTALRAAVRRRRPDAGLIHHSDRGSQYTSMRYREELQRHGITVSMSRKGNCWDNAVFEYIEVFYNRRRLHSSIGYKTPSEVEPEYAQAA